MEFVAGIYKCVYGFNAETEHDLPLSKGDIVKVTKQINAEWLEGCNQKNVFGQFPTNFVQPLFPKEESSVDRIGIVLSNFSAEQHQDLPLQKDEVVGIKKNIDINWLQGFNQDGRRGIFPASFVREIAFVGTTTTNNNNHGYDSNNNKEEPLLTTTTSTPQPMAKVIDAFQAQEPDELTINVGDEVTLTREVDTFWMEGISTNGKKGKFPKMYVKIVRDLPTSLKYQGEDKQQNESAITTPVPQARALFMFVGTHDDDLSFDKGDTIQLTRRINKEWLVGKIGNTVGKFPANYVDIIVDLPFTANTITTPAVSDNVVRNNIRNIAPSVPASPKNMAPTRPSNSKNIAPSIQSSAKSSASSTQSNSKNMAPTNMQTQRQRQPVKTKVVASSIPPIAVKRVLSNTGSPTNEVTIQNTITTAHSAQSPPKVNDVTHRQLNGIVSNKESQLRSQRLSFRKERPALPIQQQPKEVLHKKPSIKEKPSISLIRGGTIKSAEQNNNNSNNIRKSSFRERPASNSSSSSSTMIPTEETVYNKPPPTPDKANALAVSPTKETRKFSIGKKKPPTPHSPQHRFELVEEKIFDMYSNPTSKPKPNTLSRRSDCDTRPAAPSSAPNHTLTTSNNSNTFGSSSKSSTLNNRPRLPKPLAPMPAPQRKERPMSLNLQQQQQQPSNGTLYSPNNNSNNHRQSPLSPVSVFHSESFSVSFKKQQDSSNSVQYINRSSMSQSETDPKLSSKPSGREGTNTNQRNSFVKNQQLQQQPKPTMKQQQQQRPKSLYFASTASPSPEKRSLTLDAVLQRSSSLRVANNLDLQRKISGTTSITLGSMFDSMSQNSSELKRIDTEIAELKSKIEAEAHLLSGVETLLDFVSEDKKADLNTKQEQHNANIVEMNDDLNALEDQKSYLLASLGKVDDVLHRVAELEKQIEMYLDNCEQLRRMQDVAVVEELPEIRDSIEFCENMVDTLQDELNGLRDKLGEMGELTEEDGDDVDMEEMLAKKKKNQMNVIEELINTERTYCNHITLVQETMKNIESVQDKADINTKVLFGNIADIVELSSKLLQQFDSINVEGNSEEVLKKISTAFVELSAEMKDCYATYCRNYDDAQMLKEKYEEDPVTWNHIVNAINITRTSGEGYNLGSYLIKPVQRVLKYPLLLSELYKNQVDDCSSKMDLKIALDTVTDVATAINEFKRRKDLVLKYRETEDGIGKRVQKLNWHSVAKKSSRINQKITQFTGLNSQTVDDSFIDEEKRFRVLEKLIKTVLKNILQFVEEFKENSASQKQCAESLHQMLEGEEAHEEVINYYNKISQITELYTEQMLTFIKENVTEPLSQLLQLFPAPFRLIQKRNDKCLDYDRAKNKAQRARDSKERDKINQTEQELQMCENVYTALNSQLLEELPSLSQKCSSFLIYCLQSFTEARKRYFTKAFSELDTLWQLPFIKKDCDLYEWHKELINSASEQLSNLTFVPSVSNKELNRRNQSVTSEQQQQSNNGRASFFFDLDNTGTKSPTSQPLIDLKDDITPDDDTDDRALMTSSSPGGVQLVEISNHDVLIPEKLSDVVPHLIANNSHRDSVPPVISRYTVKYDFHAEHSSELSVLEGVVVNVLRRCDTSGNSEWWLVEYGGNKGFIPESFLEEYRSLASTSSSTVPDSAMTALSETSTTSVIYDENSTQYNLLPNTITLTNPNNTNNNTAHRIVGNSAFYNEASDEPPVDTLEIQSRTSNENDNSSCYSTEDSQSEESVHLSSSTAAVDSSEENCYVLEYDFEALNAGELSAKEGQVVNCLYKHDQKGNTEWWYVEYDGQRGYIPRDYLTFREKTQMC